MLRQGIVHLRRNGLRSFLLHSALWASAPLRHRISRQMIRVRFLLRTRRLRRGRPRMPHRTDPRLVISLTSFPARIVTTWATIETLMRQTLMPDAIVLVLSLEEFPAKRLPRSLRSLERRGVRVLWVPSDIGSFNKLVPARESFPDATIVTVDDDILYEPRMLERLVDESHARPGWIIGHRGWNPVVAKDGYAPYDTWTRAGGPETDPSEVLLTGVGGILYPPRTPPDPPLLDMGLATELSPSCDDAWFWGVARAMGVPRYCTGADFGTSNGLEQLTASLVKRNKQVKGQRTVKDAQIAAVSARLLPAVDPSRGTD